MIAVVYAVASIVLFSVVLALAVGRGIRLADERTPVNRADITRRAVYPPPVPPSKPREEDATWLAPWPQDVPEWDPFWWLSDDDAVNEAINEMEQGWAS